MNRRSFFSFAALSPLIAQAKPAEAEAEKPSTQVFMGTGVWTETKGRDTRIVMIGGGGGGSGGTRGAGPTEGLIHIREI